MTAFDRAWDLAKMPYYHGTSTKNLESIMQHGLEPRSEISWAETQDTDIDDEDLVSYFGRNEKRTPAEFAVSATGKWIRDQGHEVFDEDNLPVLLEIPDNVPVQMDKVIDSNQAWARTKQTIPPEYLKVIAQAHPQMTAQQFIDYVMGEGDLTWE